MPGALTMAADRRNTGPTPETRKKLVPDVIDDLVRRRVLRPAHSDAAREIEWVYLALCRGLFPASTVGVRVQGGVYRCPLERLSPAEEDAWRTHYGPWRRRVGRVAAVVISAKVDNYPPQSWEIPALVWALDQWGRK